MGVCLAGQWIRGLQMVADLTLMPDGPRVGPNPHHEAEKLIPAILFSHLYGLKNSTLYWFANKEPKTISPWSLGLIEVFQKSMKVEFLDVPASDEPQICFEDAVLFSGNCIQPHYLLGELQPFQILKLFYQRKEHLNEVK